MCCISKLMNGEKWPLVTDGAVEAQDFQKITHRFRGIYGIHLKLVTKIC